jgi:hypothetical protein
MLESGGTITMQIGQLLHNRYRLERPWHDSWLAEDTVEGVSCVLKPAGAFIDRDVPAWLARTWHPGIPRCLGQIDSPEENWLLFEYLPGRSLAEQAEASGGRLSLPVLLPPLIRLAGLLSFLHQQEDRPLVHLDIKPANLILDACGQIALIDFAAAQFLPAGNQQGDASGAVPHDRPAGRWALTPEYAAPELLVGRPCPGSDLYALGVTLLVLLTGTTAAACRSLPLPELLPGLPESLHRIIGRCLHADPEQRYAQGDELACDLLAATEMLQHGFPAHIQSLDPTVAAPDDVAGRLSGQHLPAPIISIWDGPECGCELAAVIAEDRDVVVIDANLLNPRADLLLGLRGGSRRLFPEHVVSGLDRVMREEQQGHLDPSLLETLLQTTGLPRVRLLAANEGLEHYELYQLDSLYQILKLARLTADLVIVLCNRIVFDAFTCLCLLAADQILVPLGGDVGSFREVNRNVDFLAARHPLRRDRLNYVAFPYSSRTDLSWGTMDELCGGRLVGCVSERPARRSMKSGAVPYAAALDRINRQEYRGLIKRIKLTDLQRR